MRLVLFASAVLLATLTASCAMVPCNEACPRPPASAFEDVFWEIPVFAADVCLDAVCDQVSVPRDGSMVPLPTIGGWVSAAPLATGAGTRSTVTVFDESDDPTMGLRAGQALHVVVTDPMTHETICDMTGHIVDADLGGACHCIVHRLSGFIDND